jgi:hypothetical protein
VDHADALGLGGQRHVLRLHVGGKAGILFGGDVGGAQLAVRAHAHRRRVENLHASAGFLKFVDHGAQVRGLQSATVRSPPVMAPATRKVPASMRSGLMRWRAPCRRLTPSTRMVECARAFDLCAHGGEQRGQVDDLGFARAIFHQGFAFGQHRGHQQVFGPGDGDLVENDVRAAQSLRLRIQIAVLLGDA